MTTLEILKAAREKVVRGWTRYALAVDERGIRVDYTDSRAVCWCVIGAVRAVTVYDSADVNLEQSVLESLRQATGETALLSKWNDEAGRTQADVIALYDKAIAAVAGGTYAVEVA